MSTAQFKLDMFEGPLDLLLHLISKHKLNIYDIEIAVLLEQYLEYMAGLEEADYEDAADFLEMAARLIYIKTVSLLPKDNEGEELKKELEGSLIEYSLCKMAAARLREQYAGGDIFVREPVQLPVNKTFTGEYDPEALLNAYFGMSEKARHSKPLRAEIFKPLLSQRVVSVTSKIIHVLKMLITRGECVLDSMYDGCTDKSERVAVFLAVLELTKSGRIFLNDDNTRVYMNSAAKSRKISSAFDEEELASEEEEHTVSEDTPEAVGDGASAEGLPLQEDSGDEGDEAETISPETAPLPYYNAEPTVRTVYKSEPRQRSALPVLRIELSPELQRIVDEGHLDGDDAEEASAERVQAVETPDEKAEGFPAEENTVQSGSDEKTVVTDDTADKPADTVAKEAADEVLEESTQAVETPDEKAEGFPAEENTVQSGSGEKAVVTDDTADKPADTVAEEAANEVSAESTQAVESPDEKSEGFHAAENVMRSDSGEKAVVTDDTLDKLADTVAGEAADDVLAESVQAVESPDEKSEDLPAAENTGQSGSDEKAVVTDDTADKPADIVAGEAADEVSAERTQAVETPDEKAEGFPAAENTVQSGSDEKAVVTDDTADKPEDIVCEEKSAEFDSDTLGEGSAFRFRPNFFGVRKYWNACGWAAGRLRIR